MSPRELKYFVINGRGDRPPPQRRCNDDSGKKDRAPVSLPAPLFNLNILLHIILCLQHKKNRLVGAPSAWTTKMLTGNTLLLFVVCAARVLKLFFFAAPHDSQSTILRATGKTITRQKWVRLWMRATEVARIFCDVCHSEYFLLSGDTMKWNQLEHNKVTSPLTS